ncbi:MAG: Ig-like domain-containing protein, partial [Chloroflexota bacterium]|nr:Ig-like domain-containing protein [Chloroflexota bacterium]
MLTGNAAAGIRIEPGAQGNIQQPVIVDILADGLMSGTAQPNVTIEVYTDPVSEGQTFLGIAVADGNGNWTFPLTLPQNPNLVTVLAIDSAGNTSAFSNRAGVTVEFFVQLDVDVKTKQKIIEVSGTNAVVTLADVQANLGAGAADLLQELPNSVWQLNANLSIGEGVTLNLGPQSGNNELRLRSQASISTTVDPASFVYLRTENGTLNLDGIKISSW